MDISKLPPPNDPKAQIIRRDREFSNRSNSFTFEEIEYNVAVCEARAARGEDPSGAPLPSTPRLNGWKTQFELIS
jgi:hypothetical protein